MLTTIHTSLDGAHNPTDRAPAVLLDRLAGTILGAFYAVHRELGYGFLPSVYLKALALELAQRAVRFDHQVPFGVFFKGRKIGHFRADLCVEGRVIVEVRCGLSLAAPDEAQLIHFLRSSSAELGLLLHFGPEPDFRRVEGPGWWNGMPRATEH